MRITFAPRGILQIDDARIIFRNFSGIGSKFNREGDRNFAVVIDDEDIKDALVEAGWNIKIKPAHDEDDIPFMYLPVKVKFNDRGPSVYLKSGDTINKLNEETIDCLDNVDILGVDLDIRPYDWEVNGKEGIKAYLKTMYVTIEQDVFAGKYDCLEDEDLPF